MATIALLMALAAWQVPRLVRDALTGQAADTIGREIGVGEISFNPFTLTLRVHDLQVAQPGAEPLLQVAGLEASAAWSSLVRFAPVVDRVQVREPRVAITRDGPQHFNFSDIVERVEQLQAEKPPQPEPEEDEGLPRFSLNNLQLEGGSITLDDQVTGRKHVIDEIGLGIPFISNFGYATDIDVEPRLQARINGSAFALDGTARPFDEVPRSTLNLAFLGLELDKFADAWPAPLPVALQRAMLDANLEVAFEQPRDGEARLRVTGDMAMREMDLRQPGGKPLLQWDALTLRGIDTEPLARRLHIAGIDLRSPQVRAERYENRHINWLDVSEGFSKMAAGGGSAGSKPAPAPAGQASAPAQQAAQDASAGPAEPSAPAAAPGPAEPAGAAARAEPAEPAESAESAEAAEAAESAESAESAEPAGRTGQAPSAEAAAPAGPPATPPAPAAASAGARNATAEANDPAQPAAAPTDWQISIDAVEIDGGAVQWRDAAMPLDYGLTGLSFTTGPIVLPQPADRPITLSMSAADTHSGKLDAKGTLKLAPLALDLNLRADAIALPPFAAALRKVAPMQLQDGRASAAARLALAQRDGAMQVSVHDIDATLADVAVRDESVKPAVALRLAKLSLTADRYDLAGGATAFTLDAGGVQGDGTLAVKGKYTQQPMAVQADVDLRGLDLASLAPYVASSLNATVRAMTVGARGKLAFAAAAGKSPMKVDWAGDAEVTGLDLQDRVNRSDFLKWKRLALDGMKVGLAGERVSAHLGKVTLDDFFGRVILNAEGRLNVMDLVAEPGQAAGSITQDTQTRAAPARPAAGPAPDISVAGVTLRRGRMVFTDRFVKPNYTAELSAIDGSITAVSSTNPTPAKVRVAGRVYSTAPFSVSGTVQPFAKFLALDLKASAQGVDLPRFTTYSAKYMGYPITRGKLSLDLEYRIEDRELTARNRVVLNQLTLGERTDSPDAIKLPVTLAIALLKDSRGNIDINLPISGSLDDPQFSVGGIILRVFVNLITKAVTAPFTLLASAFGSGEELSYVAFEPGSARLDEQALEQVATLAKALNDRPSLRLDVSGRVDPQADEEGLRRAWLERRLRQAKAEETSTRSRKVDPAGVTVSDAERAEYLEEVYDDTDIEDKPRNFIGMAKSVPPGQMESMLLAAAPIDEDSLRRLAEARAQAVYEKLQAEGPADRIFIVAPQLDAGDTDDGGTASRVDFALK